VYEGVTKLVGGGQLSYFEASARLLEAYVEVPTGWSSRDDPLICSQPIMGRDVSGAMANGVQVGGEVPSANARKADTAPDSLSRRRFLAFEKGEKFTQNNAAM
jgi:hypothetical protein